MRLLHVFSGLFLSRPFPRQSHVQPALGRERVYPVEYFERIVAHVVLAHFITDKILRDETLLNTFPKQTEK